MQQGYAPTFAVEFQTTYGGKTLWMRFLKAISSKLTFPTKMGDFMIAQFDFTCFADDSGNVYEFSMSE